MAKTIIPFGPQHPVLPEPVNLKLELENEKVVSAVPVLGYVHRGIEKAAEQNEIRQNVFLTERICGICSFTHAWTYCQAVESLTKTEVPPRAKFLRVIYSEFGRLQSHVLWLGLFADAFGFESMFMQCWRAREIMLDTIEMVSGHRVIQSSCIIGGVRRDIDPEMAKVIEKKLAAYKEILDASVKKTIMNDLTIKQRTVGKGILPKEMAELSGAVGPTLRGSNVALDIRQTGYGAYSQLSFEPIVETGCDCYARTLVRLRETYQAIDIVREAMSKLPVGEIAVKVNELPKGETISRTEQPRGELIYYAKGNGTKNLERLKVRTPTFANIPALLSMLPGCTVTDLPVVILSIDPCISCTER